MNSEEVKITFHKGEKRKDFTMEFKRNAIFFAEKTSNKAAAKKFSVERKKKKRMEKK